MSEPGCAHTEVESATQKPLVSIGVPVRNGAAFLEEALPHVMEKTHPTLKIHATDNASSDIIERYARNDCASHQMATWRRNAA